MEQSVELLKRAAKVLAKEGPPTNEDGKNERAKQIQDGKYLILRAVSLKTNICSASNAKKVDKKFGSMLRTFTATLEKLKFGKKKPKISLKCTEKDCPGKLKEKEVHIYYDVKCVNCNKSVDDFLDDEDETVPWGRCSGMGSCDSWFCESCVDAMTLKEEIQKAEKFAQQELERQSSGDTEGSSEAGEEIDDDINGIESSLGGGDSGLPAANPDVMFRQMSAMQKELKIIQELLLDDGLRNRRKKAKQHWGSMKESWKIASKKMQEEKVTDATKTMKEMKHQMAVAHGGRSSTIKNSLKTQSGLFDHPFM